MAELEIDCRNNLGKIILPCARCLHAKSIQETKDTFRISCDFKQFSGNIYEILRISRACPHYTQNLNCLSKFILSTSASPSARIDESADIYAVEQ